MIYFIEAVGLNKIKIGYTCEIERRLPALQTASPVDLNVLLTEEGEKSKEKKLHRRFKKDRIRGEWFEYSEQIKEYISHGWRAEVQWINDMPLLLGRTSGTMQFCKDNRGWCSLVCECPSCGWELCHGWSPGFDYGKPTHRCSHCRCHPNGYYISADPNGIHKHDPRVAVMKPIRRGLFPEQLAKTN